MSATERSSMSLALRVGERILVGDDVQIELRHKSGTTARLLVVAPRDMTITRDARLSSPHPTSEDSRIRPAR